MTPKTINYVDQERQDNFSCKHENTLKSMEFSEGDEQLCLLTVGCYITDKIVMLSKTGEKLCDFISFKRMHPEVIHFSDDLKLYVFSGSTKKLYSYGIQY